MWLHQEFKFTKSVIAKIFHFSRNSYYTNHKLDGKDRRLADRIEMVYEIDDTLGHHKLGKILAANHKRVLRVMSKYQIKPRLKKRKYHYAGKSKQISRNLLLRQLKLKFYEIIFSDIFQFRLKDGSKVYCCFVIRKHTRQILAFSYGYGMGAELVVDTINNVKLIKIESDVKIIFHSDQGSQYGAKLTVDKLIEYGFTQSMSRAGTPTDNAMGERFVGIFKLAVVERYRYENIGHFIEFAQKWLNFYNQTRPHESLRNKTPNQFATDSNLQIVSYLVVNNAQ